MGRPSLSHGVALLCILTSCVLPLACGGGPSATFLPDVAVQFPVPLLLEQPMISF